MKDVDIEKDLVSISTLLATCVMIIVSRHIMIPKTSVSITPYDGNTKWIYFVIEVGDLLEKYKTILYKVSANIEKEFDW